ncbi:ABC transporter substrate-binding protein [Rhodovulum bhavnagarense]|uniref:ABC transporter substrate-binding protein n=1 Tax=Rhodovulum bhavnagarense TaxID=992286 RepID=UPI001FB7D30D|nr:ABC transporter substrate-binding protein [Rhodovulum bhavnagarense]
MVSINLCTDQLAMMLADEGQLISVSMLARDARLSPMADRARAFPANHGQAEELFLMRPGLVLAGRYGAQASVNMLRRLGIEVVQIAPARSFDDIRANLRSVGAALGREDVAEVLIARFDADLAALAREGEAGARAVVYAPNGFTSGQGTLVNDMLAAAGLRNAATEGGHSGGGRLPLERLVTLEPDLVIRAARFGGASRAEEMLDHPALAKAMADQPVRPRSGGRYICGTPLVLSAVAELAAAARALEAR